MNPNAITKYFATPPQGLNNKKTNSAETLYFKNPHKKEKFVPQEYILLLHILLNSLNDIKLHKCLLQAVNLYNDKNIDLKQSITKSFNVSFYLADFICNNLTSLFNDKNNNQLIKNFVSIVNRINTNISQQSHELKNEDLSEDDLVVTQDKNGRIVDILINHQSIIEMLLNFVKTNAPGLHKFTYLNLPCDNLDKDQLNSLFCDQNSLNNLTELVLFNIDSAKIDEQIFGKLSKLESLDFIYSVNLNNHISLNIFNPLKESLQYLTLKRYVADTDHPRGLITPIHDNIDIKNSEDPPTLNTDKIDTTRSFQIFLYFFKNFSKFRLLFFEDHFYEIRDKDTILRFYLGAVELLRKEDNSWNVRTL